MNTSAPRLIVVTRPSPVEALVQRHGTQSQAKFYLESRKQRFEPVARLDASVQAGIATVLAAVPPDWRRVRVDRADLDRFVFRPDDVVLVVGQDVLLGLGQRVALKLPHRWELSDRSTGGAGREQFESV